MYQVWPPDAGCDAAIAIDVVTDCVWSGDPLSLTVAVKVEPPAAVGVPEMTPVDERESPAGNEPEVTDHA